MSNNRRTLEERLAEKQRLLDAEMKKMKAYEAQLRTLNAKKRDEDRKARAHRLIEVGAAVESVLHQPITEEMIPLLLDWLESQEQRGHYFSKAMGISAVYDGKNATNEDGGEDNRLPIPEVMETGADEI